MPVLDVNDIQGNVIAGYATTHARYLFLTFDHVNEHLRNWLDLLVRSDDAPSRCFMLTTARVRPQDAPDFVTRNIAFTAAGMVKLGLPPDAIQALPLAFRAGMRSRAAHLGDIGASSPSGWERWCGSEIDAVVTITGWSPDACEDEIERLTIRQENWKQLLFTGALRRLHVQSANALDAERKPFASIPCHRAPRHEHFGFRDGLSNPSIEGSERRLAPGNGTLRKRNWAPMKAGEFILGYEDENRGVDLARGLRPYFRNGSYLVWRKLQQDVVGFKGRFDDDPVSAARLVGRERDGTPLVPAADGSPLPPDSNNFTYADDWRGIRCPVSAHIRRANPRDALDFAEDVVGRHRIMRRGMPYDDSSTGRPDKGLIFACFNADIERQFEFVQRRWIIDDPSRTIDTRPDPIAAPDTGVGFTSFVTTRAGEYFFQPGMLGLENLLGASKAAPR